MATPSARCSARTAKLPGSMTARPSAVLAQIFPWLSCNNWLTLALGRPSAVPIRWKRGRPLRSRPVSTLMPPPSVPTQSRAARSTSSDETEPGASAIGSDGLGWMRSTAPVVRSSRLMPLPVPIHRSCAVPLSRTSTRWSIRRPPVPADRAAMARHRASDTFHKPSSAPPTQRMPESSSSEAMRALKGSRPGTTTGVASVPALSMRYSPLLVPT